MDFSTWKFLSWVIPTILELHKTFFLLRCPTTRVSKLKFSFFLEWMQYFNSNRINQSQYTSIDVDSLRFMCIQIWKIQLLQIIQKSLTQKMLQLIGSATRHIAGLDAHGSRRCWRQYVMVTKNIRWWRFRQHGHQQCFQYYW